jgi:bacillopeptidase F (M6 metalloprotease family)
VDVVPLVGTGHWWSGFENNSERELEVAFSGPLATATQLTFDTWYFIEKGWGYGFVEVSKDGGATWATVPVSADGQVISTNDDPQGNNAEGNGITGVSGGTYGTGSPEYISATATLPAGTTDVRFRYSTDAGYLDTGWFVSNVNVGGTATGS